MIDAAGAIYVIGGYNGATSYKDVWVSTDGGAWPESVGGGRYWVGSTIELQGTTGGLAGYSGSNRGVFQGS